MPSSLNSLNSWRLRIVAGSAALAMVMCMTGCWAPFRSPGIPAGTLPDSFRTPIRTSGPVFNYAHLTQTQPSDYVLGTDDILSILLPSADNKTSIQTVRAQVMSNGMVLLPLVGNVHVSGLSVPAAQQRINEAYADGFLKEPITVTLEAKGTIGVLVLGQVKVAGVHYLPRFQNDIGNAIAAAGGLTPEAADVIEVHRKSNAHEVRVTAGQLQNIGTEAPYELSNIPRYPNTGPQYPNTGYPNLQGDGYPNVPTMGAPNLLGDSFQAEPNGSVIRIPLHGPMANAQMHHDVKLNAGDVIVIPQRTSEVFYVVGSLNQANLVRFSTGDKQRELGVGFTLPRDREIDVVTAVVMAGYIDPINSPTTVTLQRTMANGEPLLIHVDLIKARFSRLETVLVQPGDIIYLNPDSDWWWRRTFDRLLPIFVGESLGGVFGNNN